MSSHAELHVLRDTYNRWDTSRQNIWFDKDNANKWLAGCEDKKKKFMADDEIVDVMTDVYKRQVYKNVHPI